MTFSVLSKMTLSFRNCNKFSDSDGCDLFFLTRRLRLSYQISKVNIQPNRLLHSDFDSSELVLCVSKYNMNVES